MRNIRGRRRLSWVAFRMPFKVERLYAGIRNVSAVPVRGVRVGQISNTWHAPRSGNRRHEGQEFSQTGYGHLSATEGYVARVGESQLGGKTVYVLGAGGRG